MVHKDPEARKQTRRASHLRIKFGMSPQEYVAILRKQKGVCAICRSKERSKNKRELSIDHDHVSGNTRGLLCHACNMGIGNLKDNKVLCYRAYRYLKKHERKNLK